MIESVLIDFLHMEMVNQFTEKSADPSKKEAVTRLEAVGANAGYRFIEILTKESLRFRDELEIMKFICKDFWSCIFNKQVNNLRTNHNGVYILLDHEFRFFKHITDTSQYLEDLPRYSAFVCGLIRGALGNLGLTAIVTAEVEKPPCCKFHVEIQRNN